MTLPTCYSWSPVGIRQRVAYEAPQGRRVNAIGAYFTHGPQAGHFVYRTWANLPKGKSAESVGLTSEEVGPIDASRLVAFLWQIAGRPTVFCSGWKRSRPLVIVMDNYAVHKSQVLKEAQADLLSADIHLLYLPSYCPELSAIEPVWRDVKHRQMPIRSFSDVKALKEAVESGLCRKAEALRQPLHKTTNLMHRAA